MRIFGLDYADIRVPSRAVALAVVAVLCFAASVAAGPRPKAAPTAAPTPSLGDRVFAAGDFDGAAATYKTVLDDAPKDVDAQLGLANVALTHDDLDAATTYLDAVAKLDPANAAVPRLRAIVAQRRQDARSDIVAPYRAPVIVPFEVADPLPLVHVNVDGRDALFVIDTGTGNLTLDPAFAAAAGVTLANASHGVAQSVQLGAILMHDVPVDALPTRTMKLWGTRQVDGIVGLRFLEHFLPTIDYVHQALILRPRGDADAFERDAAAHGAYVQPMALFGDRFALARGRINNGPDGWFVVDTGLAGAGLMPSKAALADSGIAPGVTPFVAAVVLGKRRVDNLDGVVAADGDPFAVFPFAVRGSVAHEYFRGVALTLDFTTMQLVMEP